VANAHVHEIFRKILEPLMAKPRTQAELDAQAKLEDEWNAGARQADATWWQQPHERGAGRTYERRCIGATRDGNVPVYEQVEKGTL
jgi:hypothetical protein